jgi:hypothetical protein
MHVTRASASQNPTLDSDQTRNSNGYFLDPSSLQASQQRSLPVTHPARCVTNSTNALAMGDC